MAEKTPDTKVSHDMRELSDAQKAEVERRRRKSMDSTDSARFAFKEIEEKTLQQVLDYRTKLGGRFKTGMQTLVPFTRMGGSPTAQGQIVASIRALGDKEAADLDGEWSKKLKEFGVASKERLSALSLKTATKFNRITSRIRVADRVKRGVAFMNERWQNEIKRMRSMSDALQKMHGKSAKGKMPAFLTREMRDTRKAEKETRTLIDKSRLAADQVLSEEKPKYNEYKQDLDQRFEGERRLETDLRALFAEHLPSELGRLDMALQSAAQGNTKELENLKNDLQDKAKSNTFDQLPPVLRNSVVTLLNQVIKSISNTGKKAGREYAKYKAFQTAGQLELNRLDPKHFAEQLAGKPLGTRLRLVIDSSPSQGGEFVIVNTSDSSNIVLQRTTPVNEDYPNEAVFIDLKHHALVAKNYDEPKHSKRQKRGAKKGVKEDIVTYRYESHPIAEEGVSISLAA